MSERVSELNRKTDRNSQSMSQSVSQLNRNNGIIVIVRVVLVCVGIGVKRTMYQRQVDVDMLNAVKSVLADVSSVSPSSEQRALCCDEELTLESVSQ